MVERTKEQQGKKTEDMRAATEDIKAEFVRVREAVEENREKVEELRSEQKEVREGLEEAMEEKMGQIGEILVKMQEKKKVSPLQIQEKLSSNSTAGERNLEKRVQKLEQALLQADNQPTSSQFKLKDQSPDRLSDPNLASSLKPSPVKLEEPSFSFKPAELKDEDPNLDLAVVSAFHKDDRKASHLLTTEGAETVSQVSHKNKNLMQSAASNRFNLKPVDGAATSSNKKALIDTLNSI